MKDNVGKIFFVDSIYNYRTLYISELLYCYMLSIHNIEFNTEKNPCKIYGL